MQSEQESRQELKEHHLEPGVRKAALCKAVACGRQRATAVCYGSGTTGG